ncbi:DMT family transporter [Legionella pneumophila]|uniref:DMT family transporter n=1 Tax=Legionella pneumophila TaxID=446 RepID=UPI00026DA380|nr:DMT family transporter [Legionella pneumophila]MDW9140113.1 DMT family transporter [Legionella pneumophila]CCD09936.1 putative Lipoprotein [Legionella pneumophila subsp. pneumophila]CZG92184.1 Predicted permease%2C DMT superfamily [Legionella pneumophila]CZI25456.1 Predicted permease%2C DMT superfamily [Legionella pneumophila]CZI27767.1 Predicted permease%2C DMT superfamily [Legionella pneumophila]
MVIDVKKSNTYFIQGMLFLIFAQIMVGINIVFSKYVLSSIPVLYILALRFTLAAVILLLLHWLTPAKKLPVYSYFLQLKRRDWFFIFAQALSAGVLFNFLILWGLQYTDANVAGIITSALPAIIAIMSWLILGEKISGKKAICVGFATLGLVVIACDKLGNINVSHSFLGDALVLTSLLPEAMYYILSKMHVNSLPVFLISSLLNGINAILLLFFLSFSTWDCFTIHTLDWLILIILGLSSGLFYVFWYFGCQAVDGVMASLSTAVMPLATVTIAWIFLGEQLTIGQIIGMGMVILSITVYAKR